MRIPRRLRMLMFNNRSLSMTNVTFQNEWDYRENVRYLQSATRIIIYVHYLFDET